MIIMIMIIPYSCNRWRRWQWLCNDADEVHSNDYISDTDDDDNDYISDTDNVDYDDNGGGERQ